MEFPLLVESFFKMREHFKYSITNIMLSSYLYLFQWTMDGMKKKRGGNTHLIHLASTCSLFILVINSNFFLDLIFFLDSQRTEEGDLLIQLALKLNHFNY
jgi:hypothetical protein